MEKKKKEGYGLPGFIVATLWRRACLRTPERPLQEFLFHVLSVLRYPGLKPPLIRLDLSARRAALDHFNVTASPPLRSSQVIPPVISLFLFPYLSRRIIDLPFVISLFFSWNEFSRGGFYPCDSDSTKLVRGLVKDRLMDSRRC